MLMGTRAILQWPYFQHAGKSSDFSSNKYESLKGRSMLDLFLFFSKLNKKSRIYGTSELSEMMILRLGRNEQMMRKKLVRSLPQLPSSPSFLSFWPPHLSLIISSSSHDAPSLPPHLGLLILASSFPPSHLEAQNLKKIAQITWSLPHLGLLISASSCYVVLQRRKAHS